MLSKLSNARVKRALAVGLCALPARRDQKRPAVGRWRQYRKRLPTKAELSAWFANGADAICILCGRVSHNAEMIDFDAGGELFDAWTARIPPDLLAKLVIETTQRDGRHVYYLCKGDVSGNMKLAQRRDGDKIVTLIETRGEGGLFLCAPTDEYELIQGDLANPPVLTMAERDLLLQAAWDLNEYIPPVMNGPAAMPDVGHTAPLSAHSSNNPPTLAHQANNPVISAHNANSARHLGRQFAQPPYPGRQCRQAR